MAIKMGVCETKHFHCVMSVQCGSQLYTINDFIFGSRALA